MPSSRYTDTAPGWWPVCEMAVEVITLVRTALLDRGTIALIRAGLGPGPL